MENEKRKGLIIYVKEEERAIIKDKAKALRISISRYVKDAVLDKKLPNFEKVEATRNLLKINADIARLGNLLKLAIDEGVDTDELDKLATELKETQDILRAKIKEL